MYSKTHLINTFLLKEEYNNLFKSLPENTSATVFATDGFSLCGYVSHAPINKIKFIILEDYHSTKNVLVRYDVTFKQVLNEIKTSLKIILYYLIEIKIILLLILNLFYYLLLI